MQDLEVAYLDFVSLFMQERPLRSKLHVQLVLEAAGISAEEANDDLWLSLDRSWVDGALDGCPFTGPDAAPKNARYVELCRSRGVDLAPIGGHDDMPTGRYIRGLGKL